MEAPTVFEPAYLEVQPLSVEDPLSNLTTQGFSIRRDP